MLAYRDDVENMDEIKEVYYSSVTLARYDIKGHQHEFNVHGVEDFNALDNFFSGIVFLDDYSDVLAKTPNGIVIDEYQADKFSLEIGDTFYLMPLDENYDLIEPNEKIEVAVAGIMNSIGYSQNRTSVFTHADFYNKHFKGHGHHLTIKVHDHVKPEKAKESVSTLFIGSDASITTFDEDMTNQKAAVDSLLKGILIIIFMGLFIGVLGISNNLLLSFNQRKKEYAILHTTSMSRVQIIKMVLIEMLMTFFNVVIIGLAGGYLLFMLMKKLLYSIGLRIDIVFTYDIFALLCGAVFLLLALSALSLIRKVYKLDMLQELRYE